MDFWVRGQPGHRVSSSTARAVQRNPVSKNQKKNLHKSGIQSSYLNIIKNNIQQANNQYQIKWSGQHCLLSHYLFSVKFEVLARAIRLPKDNKWIKNGRVQLKEEDAFALLFLSWEVTFHAKEKYEIHLIITLWYFTSSCNLLKLFLGKLLTIHYL